MKQPFHIEGSGRGGTQRSRVADTHVSRLAADAGISRVDSETQLCAKLADRVLELERQLRDARGQFARFGETLIAIQRSILPRTLPVVPGLELAVHFSGKDEAGGDFYDVSPLGPESWAIVVADVSGHGLAAAAVLALTHALGHALQEQGTPPSPGAALALINGALAARYLVNSGQFVTAFVGWFNARTQVLKYASAGHPTPRLVRDNDVRRLDAVSGIPLGVDGESFYQEAAVQLYPRDRLVLFTDGLTEGINAAGELFGDHRLDEVLRTPANRATKNLEHIVNSVKAFRAGLPPSDDETCLVVVVNPIASSQQSESEEVRC